MIDLYEVLQVDRHAEPEVIRAAYRALARRHHPDFGGGAREMARINDAWAVLGDPARRAAYDAEPKATGEAPAQGTSTTTAPSADQVDCRPAAPAPGHGLAGRRPVQPQASGSVLDFGRYTGWTVGALADHDPDYLEWLARTPIGRPIAAEIEAVLSRRAAAASPPGGQPQPRRRAFL
jgi:curved DNA-binding protein CbpA